MNLHISHSGGTYLCRLAMSNNERVHPRINCNLPSDALMKLPEYRTCQMRVSESKIGNYSFIATERGLVEGEYCPDDFSYMLFMRNPLNVINSAFSWRGVENITQLMSYAEKNTNHIDEFLRLFSRRDKIRITSVPKIPLLYRADNYFTRFLAFNAEAQYAPWSKVTHEHYEMALANIKKFDLVFTEDDISFHFDKVSQDVSSQLNWNTTLMKTYNSTLIRNSHGPHRFSKELQDYIVELNKYDLMLYEHTHRYHKQNEGLSRKT